MHLFLQLGERSSVGGLVLLEELEHLLDLLRAELLADGVEVAGLVAPELNLSQRVWVVVTLERVLWVLLELVLDLLGPVDDGSLKDDSLIFG